MNFLCPNLNLGGVPLIYASTLVLWILLGLELLGWNLGETHTQNFATQIRGSGVWWRGSVVSTKLRGNASYFCLRYPTSRIFQNAIIMLVLKYDQYRICTDNLVYSYNGTFTSWPKVGVLGSSYLTHSRTYSHIRPFFYLANIRGISKNTTSM